LPKINFSALPIECFHINPIWLRNPKKKGNQAWDYNASRRGKGRRFDNPGERERVSSLSSLKGRLNSPMSSTGASSSFKEKKKPQRKKSQKEIRASVKLRSRRKPVPKPKRRERLGLGLH